MRTLSFLYRSLMGTVATTAFLMAGAAHAQVPGEDWETEANAGSWMTVQTASGFGETCDTYADGTSDADNEEGTVDTLDFSGNFICNFLASAQDLPYRITYDTSTSPNQATFHDVNVDTSLGNCSGDVVGEWHPDSGASQSSGTGTVEFDEAPIGSSGCETSGEIHIVWPRP